ncbi:hypothetical protein [Klebsiella phage vB_KpnP1]|uniref:Uncharacterized protein n=1 Tax=Klebsiella phage vB_KpnP1 TaxID=2961845 RepID=A0A9E7NYW0_9CAUD|nr:hypothetical protein [Klebsiella phage vB_KpnP1]
MVYISATIHIVKERCCLDVVGRYNSRSVVFYLRYANTFSYYW